MQHDAVERLELYGRVISGIVAEIREQLDASLKDKKLWATMKQEYAELISCCQDIELAETFFNSVSRRIFTTIGVDPRIEFLFSDFDTPPEAGTPVYETYPASRRLPELIKEILVACEFSAPFENLERDVHRVARAIERRRRDEGITAPVDAIDMIHAVFYRNQGAFLVGRIVSRRPRDAPDAGAPQ